MLLKDLLNFRFPNYSTRRYAKRRGRGMSWSTDVVDWIGGYPFEVAKPEQIFDFYRARGFQLVRLFTTNRNGCNEFVFEKR